jgi:hypothetical protein
MRVRNSAFRDNHVEAVVVSRLLKVHKKVTSVRGSTYMAPYTYPKSAKKVADALVKEVPKHMEKDGLLPKKVASN